MSKFCIRFRSSQGISLVSKHAFSSRKSARNSINELKRVEMKVRGKISPQVKGARVEECF